MGKFGRFMPRVLKPIILFCVVAVSLSQVLASDPSLPKSDELIKKFVTRSKEEDREKLDEKYGFVEHRLHDELDKYGKVREHSDETFRYIMLKGHPYPRLIAKDGKSLVPEEQRKQVEREKRFQDEQQRKAADTNKSGDSDGLKLDDLFLNHFKFDVVGREDLNGRPSFIVTVLPRPGNLPVRNNAEKIFSHMQGKVWVDAQDYTLAKCDLHLVEPTSFYGVLGSVRQVDLLLQRRWVENNVWLAEKLIFAIDARKLFTPIRVRQHSEFSDFKKLKN